MTQPQDTLTTEILKYLSATGMPPTRFGKCVNNDASLVAQIVAGREPRRKTVSRIRKFMAQNPPPDNAGEGGAMISAVPVTSASSSSSTRSPSEHDPAEAATQENRVSR